MSSPNAPLDYASPINASNTSAFQISVVLLKLMGLNQLITFIQWLPYLAGAVTGVQAPGTESWMLVISPVLSLAIAAILITRATPIARALFGRDFDASIRVGPAGWMTILISAIGLYLIVTSLEPAVRSAIQFGSRAYQNTTARIAQPIEARELFMMLSPLFIVGIGFALFLRPRWLLGWWQRKVVT